MAAVGEFERVIESWDGEQVLVRFDVPTGTWIFICIHSRLRGPAAGGTRMKVYESTVDAVRDGTRLAAGMTVKMAVAGFPWAEERPSSQCPRCSRARSAKGCSAATPTPSPHSAGASGRAAT